MNIKIKGKTYETAKIPKYNLLINKLGVIFSSNKQNIYYKGIIEKGRLGVLVCGTDNNCVREFVRFYSISEINHYFNKQIYHLRNEGERQRMGI